MPPYDIDIDPRYAIGAIGLSDLSLDERVDDTDTDTDTDEYEDLYYQKHYNGEIYFMVETRVEENNDELLVWMLCELG
jgi:hypothetical protein